MIFSGLIPMFRKLRLVTAALVFAVGALMQVPAQAQTQFSYQGLLTDMQDGPYTGGFTFYFKFGKFADGPANQLAFTDFHNVAVGEFHGGRGDCCFNQFGDNRFVEVSIYNGLDTALLSPLLQSTFDGFHDGSFQYSLDGTMSDGVTYKLKFGTAIAAVPEPEIVAMLFAGLWLVGYAARRRNAQAGSRVPVA